MKRLNIILLIIIIILAIVLGFMTYYMFYWKNGYLNASNTMVEIFETLEDAGVKIQSIDNGPSQVIIKQKNKIIMEETN